MWTLSCCFLYKTWKLVFIFNHSWYWNDTGSWNLSSWKTSIPIFDAITTMAADDLATYLPDKLSIGALMSVSDSLTHCLPMMSWSTVVGVLAGNIAASSHYLYRCWLNYRKTSSISRTKSHNLNVFCILLQLPSLNPLKPCVKLRMKM